MRRTVTNHFIKRVETLLRDGFGVEDIAIKLNVRPEIIRREVEIYRSEGRLKAVLGVHE